MARGLLLASIRTVPRIASTAMLSLILSSTWDLRRQPYSAQSSKTAGLVVWCRRQRLALLQGGEFDVSKYTTATNALRRLLEDIGQERRLKDVTPDLHEYLRESDAP
jgi:hypothetical protein